MGRDARAFDVRTIAADYAALLAAGRMDEAALTYWHDDVATFEAVPGEHAETHGKAEALAKAPLPVVPGAASPTELLALLARGFRVCKLFPATAVGGLAMIKGVAGPIPELKLCPTGGITEDTAADYLKQKNVLCIGGSWMVQDAWIRNGQWDQVRQSAAAAAAIVRAVRAG